MDKTFVMLMGLYILGCQEIESVHFGSSLQTV